MEDNKKINQFLQDWFNSNHNINISINERYIELETIDSFDVISLITLLESKYNIKFLAEDLQDPSIYTISGISKIITNKMSSE